MGPNVTKHYFGDFNTTLRELINLQGNWRSNKLDHTINQRGTASTPVEFFAYINGSPANDENVNLSALADRCGYLYLTYNILWDRDYYDAFESTSWIFVLALAIDITVLLFKWSLNKGYLKKEKNLQVDKTKLGISHALIKKHVKCKNTVSNKQKLTI